MMNYSSGGADGSAPAVRAQGLTTVRGGRTILDSLDFTVPQGQITGLLGPSGCGKSTLMRSLVGVQANVTGTIEVLGLPAGDRHLRNRIGYVTQAPSVYADMSTRQNLQYFAEVLSPAKGRAGKQAREDEIDRVLGDIDLTDHADTLVGNLSGGQCSRVSLGVALLGRPELLILDEPTVGLDPVLRRELWALFARFAQQGTSILVSSHVMDEAERCDRLLLMRAGRILADDTPQRLRDSTASTTIEEAFLRLVDEAAGRTPSQSTPAHDTEAVR